MARNHDTTEIRRLIAEHPGLGDAILALSWFRNRHARRALYKKSRRHNTETVSQYARNVELSRQAILKARAAGWRGSVYDTITGKEV